MEQGALRSMLALSACPGVGPIAARRLLERFGSADAAMKAPVPLLQQVHGIGPKTAQAIVSGRESALNAADEEIERGSALNVSFVAVGEPGYPAPLSAIPDPPIVLRVLGELRAEADDRFALGVVGSRACTSYGIEQAERFAGVLARSGLTIVSGGARGIDTAAHRGALRSGGRTIVVLGCGLAHRYPPDNAELFDRIVAEGRGALISGLPLDTPPKAENFPPRNRIISGLSLGVLVIEAARGSGALITAHQAAEDHGREVMVVPGRVDSPPSEGALDLVKSGCGGLVTDPGDVLAALESSARHLFEGSFEARFSGLSEDAATLFESRPAGQGGAVSDSAVLSALNEPRTIDELVRVTGLDVTAIQRELTLLELSRHVVREGGRVRKARRQ